MPKLVIFAACEKVLIDQDNNLSLITVLSKVTADIPQPPENLQEKKAFAAMKWNALTMWQRADDERDDGKEYEQRIALIEPVGEAAGLELKTAWKFGEKGVMRNTGIVLGFPVYRQGRFMLKLWMQEKGQEESVNPMAEYQIVVKYAQQK